MDSKEILLDLETQKKIVISLKSSNSYPHEVSYIKIKETHMSWIILTGLYAYKIKKILLNDKKETRTRFNRLKICQKEIELNKVLAPKLYIGVSKVIRLKDNSIFINSCDKVHEDEDYKFLDVATKMYEFPEESLLKGLVNCNQIDECLLKRIASKIALYDLNDNSNYYSETKYTEQRSSLTKNIEIIRKLYIKDYRSEITLINLEKWTNMEIKRLKNESINRINNNSFKYCHGDLHSENIYRIENQFEFFDCIDYDKKLNHIDPINDLLALVVDLFSTSNRSASNQILNNWLEITGDYESLIFFKLYSVYRALVKAKVEGLRYSNLDSYISTYSKEYKSSIFSKYKKYIALAQKIKDSKPGPIIMMHGLSGSGKSFYSRELCRKYFGIRISSDIERKRIFYDAKNGSQKDTRVNKAIKSIIRSYNLISPYDRNITEVLYKIHIPETINFVLKSDLAIIIDATYLRESERNTILKIATMNNRKFAIINCDINDKIAEDRIIKRQKNKNEESEADINVRRKQKEWLEPLTPYEKEYEIIIGRNSSFDYITKALDKIIYPSK